MTTNVQVERVDQLGLPWDLTDWCEGDLLCQWINEEVETFEWSDPKIVAFLQSHPDFRPKTLLKLILYAYATGVYASEEIVNNCYSEKRYGALCEGPAPTTQELIAFRRENRGLLQWYLVQMFKRALKFKFDMGQSLLPAGLKQCLADAAVARIDIARHLDRGAGGF